MERDETDADRAVSRGRHALVQKVTDDFDRWAYNTAMAACMEYVNDLYRYIQSDRRKPRQEPSNRRSRHALYCGHPCARTSRPSCGSAAR